MKHFLSSYFQNTFTLKTGCVTILVAFLFVFSGPFGTFDNMTLGERAIFWVPTVFLALVVGGFACEIERRCFATKNWYRHGLLSSVAFAILYAPLVYLIWSSGVLGLVESYMPFWYVLGAVFTFAVILGLFIILTNEGLSEFIGTPTLVLPRLYARLPEVGDARIAHITVSDHYVEVYFSDGTSHRILMRFADAVQEMDEAQGFCTHRSHWVATAFVKAGKRVEGKDFVELSSGKTVPVSKTYRDNLVQAGFL